MIALQRHSKSRFVQLGAPASSFLAMFIAGCSESSNAPPDASIINEVEIFPDAEALVPDAQCVVRTAQMARPAQSHVAVCSDLEFETSPPCGGTHFSKWADFTEYSSPVPWGYLVHSMEHGAVILAYGCQADECPEVVDAFRAIRLAKTDNACTRDPANRIIIVPDPTLDVPIAAAAWGKFYRASCLDVESLQSFVDGNYARAPENFCASGVNESNTGWCEGVAP